MKIEYGDFYKFIVSIGLGLMGLAFLVPWLFLSQPFDLYIESETLKKLTPLAQSIIGRRQETVEWIIESVRPFYCVAFPVGLIAFVIGLYLWVTRTHRIQERMSLASLQILMSQLRQATKDEVKEKAEADTQSQDVESIEESQKPPFEGLTFDAIAAEEKVSEKFQMCFGTSYEVLSNQKLNQFIYDVLLLSKSTTAADYIVEIKHIRSGFKFGWLHDNAVKLVFASGLYQRDSGRGATPILIIVAPKTVLEDSQRQAYKQRIKKDSLVRKFDFKLVYLPKEELDSMPCDVFRKLIEDKK